MTAPTVERFGPDVAIDALVEAIDRVGPVFAQLEAAAPVR